MPVLLLYETTYLGEDELSPHQLPDAAWFLVLQWEDVMIGLLVDDIVEVPITNGGEAVEKQSDHLARNGITCCEFAAPGCVHAQGCGRDWRSPGCSSVV